MIEFITGFGVALLLLIFIGWVDVALMGKPIRELRVNHPIKTYMIVTSWELLLFIAGIATMWVYNL